MTALTAFAFATAYGNQNRTLTQRFADIVSASEFATLQDALDYCYGTSADPHGSGSATDNKVLFIPPGYYAITTPLTLTLNQGARIIGSGRFVTYIENTAGGSVFVTNGSGYCHFEGMTLKAADGLQATVTMSIATPAVVTWNSHGLAAGDPVIFTSTGQLSDPVIAGGDYYVLSAGLTSNTFRFAVTPGGTAINTTGGSQFGTQTAFSGTTIFDLDWDGSAGGSALQSNTFHDIYFEGGAIGVNIGKTGFMGSETLFADCFWKGCRAAGLKTVNYNALQQTVIGGNLQTCGYGIWCVYGAVPTIHGTGFQESTFFDVLISRDAHDTYSICGCRTESPNFVKSSTNRGVIAGCSQTTDTSGYFFQGQNFKITGCETVNGVVRFEAAGTGGVDVFKTGRGADWIDTATLNGANNIEICNVLNSVGLITRKRLVGDGLGATTTYTYTVT